MALGTANRLVLALEREWSAPVGIAADLIGQTEPANICMALLAVVAKVCVVNWVVAVYTAATHPWGAHIALIMTIAALSFCMACSNRDARVLTAQHHEAVPGLFLVATGAFFTESTLVRVFMTIVAGIEVQPGVFRRLPMTLCALHLHVRALQREAGEIVVQIFDAGLVPVGGVMAGLTVLAETAVVGVVFFVAACAA